MLLWLLDYLEIPFDTIVALEKITPRAALAAAMSFFLAVILGPRWIAWLKHRFREPIKSDSPEIARLHAQKHATPTMGGLFIMAALLTAYLLLGNLKNPYVAAVMVVGFGMATVGIIDDLVKLRSKANGIPAQQKFLMQIIVATIAAVLLYQQQANLTDGLLLRLPFWGNICELGIWFIPLAVLVIVGSANAVNLTDGLDGLAGGCFVATITAMTALVYAAGHVGWAEYLGVPRIPHAGEMTVLAGGMIGAVLGFLWFNCYPAQVFMGDTGSLPLGGLLATLALIARQELLLIIIAGVFVTEALSVILQVGVFKICRKRVFRCAPIHHHFQFLGVPENKIVVRFWIAAALCALVGVSILKLDTSCNSAKETKADVLAKCNNWRK